MKQLQSIDEISLYPEIKVWVLAENIRSAYNIGAILRTADGTNQTGLICAGYTPSVQHLKVQKTSLGAERTVPWLQLGDDYIETLLSNNRLLPIYSLEITKNAQDIFTWEWDKKPLILAIGNEVEGISPKLLEISIGKIYIPMLGSKQSLNVAEAASISLYEFFRKNH